jgi:hypothetical protein
MNTNKLSKEEEKREKEFEELFRQLRLKGDLEYFKEVGIYTVEDLAEIFQDEDDTNRKELFEDWNNWRTEHLLGSFTNLGEKRIRVKVLRFLETGDVNPPRKRKGTVMVGVKGNNNHNNVVYQTF